jgi:hypothetical protein
MEYISLCLWNFQEQTVYNAIEHNYVSFKDTFQSFTSIIRPLTRCFKNKIKWNSLYKVVQIWPGLIVCKLVTVCPGHIWTTLYIHNTGSHCEVPHVYNVFTVGNFKNLCHITGDICKMIVGRSKMCNNKIKYQLKLINYSDVYTQNIPHSAMYINCCDTDDVTERKLYFFY